MRIDIAALALIATLAAPSIARAQYEGLHEGAAPTPTHDGFLGQRPLLKDLSPADQALLAKLILDYTTANKSAVVKAHSATMMDPKLHAVHKAPYTLLFSWHHAYIHGDKTVYGLTNLEGLETHLQSIGQGRFVPLPKWIPSDPIPQVFGEDKNGKSLIQNYDPKQDWTQFYHSKLSVFIEDVRQGPNDTTANASILADTLVVPHNNTHNIIGGTMASMSSPAVPIFWCYHAFIDDIWFDWQQVHKTVGAPKTAATLSPDAIVTLNGVVGHGAGATLRASDGTTYALHGDLVPLLDGADGRSVWVQAKLRAKDATLVAILGDNGMLSLAVHKDPRADASSTAKIMGMGEVKVVGASQDGAWLEVDTGLARGFVPKSAVAIGAKTDGLSGALHHHH